MNFEDGLEKETQHLDSGCRRLANDVGCSHLSILAATVESVDMPSSAFAATSSHFLSMPLLPLGRLLRFALSFVKFDDPHAGAF